ncbi:hypothetical protein BS47DRAFT_1338391 [Hydnum rufescens UP504]|uniref:SH3 domain-containing protein n=1 Tax=Hydnum rufescens UP504 TaxID=1448309 RepID=A0A9P6B723_9AGAM|nr:hypothetical protein BS47DRAFT_1338391 [Hydnum rufescens UP504]
MFAEFTQEDKEAFFALLDEYFESRPHLRPQGGGSTTNAVNDSVIPATPEAAVAAAVGRSVAQNPQAAANLVSRGFNKWNNSASEGNANAPPASQGVNTSNSSNNSAMGNGFPMGKVAAAAASLQTKGLNRFGGGAPSSSSPAPPAVPPQPSRWTPPAPVATSRPPVPAAPSRSVPSFAAPPPRRVISNTNANANFGNNGHGSGNQPPPPPPPASSSGSVARAKSHFAPPPVRRVTPVPAPRPEPEPEEQEQEEEEVEWAQALYAYTSSDPGDIPLKENQRVRIIERTSDDWWTGEVNGRQGLFPSAYVQVL